MVSAECQPVFLFAIARYVAANTQLKKSRHDMGELCKVWAFLATWKTAPSAGGMGIRPGQSCIRGDLAGCRTFGA